MMVMDEEEFCEHVGCDWRRVVFAFLGSPLDHMLLSPVSVYQGDMMNSEFRMYGLNTRHAELN